MLSCMLLIICCILHIVNTEQTLSSTSSSSTPSSSSSNDIKTVIKREVNIIGEEEDNKIIISDNEVLNNIDQCANPVTFGRNGPWTSLYYDWDYWPVCLNYASRCQTSWDFVICESSKGWASPHMSMPFVSTFFFGWKIAWLIQGLFEIFEATVLTLFGDYIVFQTADAERETLAGSLIGDWVHALPAVFAAWLLIRAYKFWAFLPNYVPTTRRFKLRDHETLDKMPISNSNHHTVFKNSDTFNATSNNIYNINEYHNKGKQNSHKQYNNNINNRPLRVLNNTVNIDRSLRVLNNTVNIDSITKHTQYNINNDNVNGVGDYSVISSTKPKDVIGFDEAIDVFEGDYIKNDDNHNVRNVTVITAVSKAENSYFWILRWKYILIWLIFGLLHIPVQFVTPEGCLDTVPPTCTHTGLIIVTLYIPFYFILVYFLFMRTKSDELYVWRGFPPKYRLQLFLWGYLGYFLINLQNFGVWIRYFGAAGGFTQVWFVVFIWILLFGIYHIYVDYKSMYYASKIRWVSIRTGAVDSYHWTVSPDRYWYTAACCGCYNHSGGGKERKKRTKKSCYSCCRHQNKEEEENVDEFRFMEDPRADAYSSYNY